MELKFDDVKSVLGELSSSNRTFMELKYQNTTLRITGSIVLIAPLWN